MRIKIECKSCDDTALFLPKKFIAKATTNAVYSLLNSGNREYGRWIHEVGWQTPRGVSVKLFSYSRLYSPRFIFSEEGAYYASKDISFYVTSPIPEVITTLVNGAMLGPPVKLGDKLFSVANVIRIEEPVFSEKIKLKTLSPIQVTASSQDLAKGEPLHLTAENRTFLKRLEKVVKIKWAAFLGREPENFALAIKSLQTKVSLSFHEGAGRTFPVTTGIFELTGKPEILKFAYDVGLGQRTGSGYGCMEVTKCDIL